jgi:hypothetical protein
MDAIHQRRDPAAISAIVAISKSVGAFRILIITWPIYKQIGLAFIPIDSSLNVLS